MELPITLLFWNIHKRPEAFESVVRLVSSLVVHVLLIAEMPLPDEPGLQDQPTSVLCDALNRPARIPGLPEFRLISEAQTESRRYRGEDVVQVYSRLPGRCTWQRRTIDGRYTVWEIAIRGYRKFHLAAVHFTSIQNDQGDEQRQCAVALRHDLERAEQALNKRTNNQSNDEPLSIVMGDLNANPFDAGIAGVYGLNATGLRETARTSSRDHQGRNYPYLFNPMWRFLSSAYPGTYYGKEDIPIRFDWFLIDQVLVRPGLLDLFDRDDQNGGEDVRILTHDGERFLVEGPLQKPIKAISDHLPVMFRFRLPAT